VTQDFDNVRAAFASSIAGRALAGAERAIESAWRSSSFRTAMRTISHNDQPATDLVRTIAIAIAIAAAIQPVLIVMMPRVARPWMPWIVFIAVAMIASAVAWRPAPVASTWPQSRLARWLRR
jgi:predicted membrane channel-forming protein YqfA (hemolysin III family)